jgi:hypothetical protein
MKIQIETMKALIALLRQESVDLGDLTKARVAVSDFDLERTAIPHLIQGMEACGLTNPDTSQVFSVLRYPTGAAGGNILS